MPLTRKQGIVPKNKVLILTNGEHTEKNYFELLKSKIRMYYSISVKFENADPAGLVEKAISIGQEYNRVWCVFDVDQFQRHEKIKQAYELAHAARNVSIACSNQAFEVWLLNHYSEFRTRATPRQLTQHMNALLSSISTGSPAYKKTNVNLLKDHFVPKHLDAMHNAKKMHQVLQRDRSSDYADGSKPPIWELESATTVYMLLEFLLHAKRK